MVKDQSASISDFNKWHCNHCIKICLEAVRRCSLLCYQSAILLLHLLFSHGIILKMML